LLASSSGPKPVAGFCEVLLEYGFEHVPQSRLYHSVPY
jgi:hypothetical protein